MPAPERPLQMTGQRQRSQRGRQTRGRPQRTSKYRRRRVLAGLYLVLVVVVLWFLFSLFQPLHGSGSGKIKVVIPRDSSTSQIASILTKDDVVGSSFFFKLRAKLSGDSSKFRAGRFTLAKDMSYGSALTALTKAPAVAPTTSVVIPPARSRTQVQQALKDSGIAGNYVAATRKSPLLNPTVYGAPKTTPTLEGFLWPDTYDLRHPVKIHALIKDQLTTFKQEFAKVNFAYAKAHNLTRYDVLIIASLISEETYKPSDAPKAASVIYNRLRLGMDLGLDSTVSYATGNYGDLTEKDLESKSPWNTTNHAGLPPTPIDSPDLAAITAAAHPSKTGYTYFINRVCGNGALNFTSSYSQFEQWSANYDAATAKAAKHGGNAEFCKHGHP